MSFQTVSLSDIRRWVRRTILRRKPIDTDKVVEGRGGMLFLDHDSNRVMRQITGRMVLSSRVATAIRRAHAEREAICATLGCAYRHVICPNKESVLTEHLPPHYRYESHGPTVMARYLDAFRPDVPFYDRQLLNAEGAYYTTDSHWTETGAMAYLRAALAHVGDRDTLVLLDAIEIQPVAVDRVGDLGLKLENRSERCVRLHLPARRATLEFESSMTGEGYVRLERCPAHGAGKALVLHDSFTESLYLILAECYAETLFLRTPHFDRRFVAGYKPDVVWFFQAERFFPRVPRNDIRFADWIAEQERRKGQPAHASLFMRDMCRA